MNQEEIVDYWKIEADESLKVATHLFDKKRLLIRPVFWSFWRVGKNIKKQFFVQNVSPNVPRTHNLPRLAKAAQVPVTEQQEYDLVRITAFNLEARYPDYKREFRKKCTAEFSTTETQKIKEVFSWLKSML